MIKVLKVIYKQILAKGENFGLWTLKVHKSSHAQEIPTTLKVTCDIYTVVGGGSAYGDFKLTVNPLTGEARYKLNIGEDKDSIESFNGPLYFAGGMSFTGLSEQTQKEISKAIRRRPDLKTGSLVSYSNVTPESGELSTLSIHIMPSAEIIYIQAGVLPVLCAKRD